MFYVNVSGIDLENIVYYKDDTHYFVMTAKKQSLLEKGVILQVKLLLINVVSSTKSLNIRSLNLN